MVRNFFEDVEFFLLQIYTQYIISSRMPHAPKKSQASAKKAVLVIFPAEVVDALDRVAKREDTDRSKFIRRAVRNAMRNIPA
jgi:hypothetical protein